MPLSKETKDRIVGEAIEKFPKLPKEYFHLNATSDSIRCGYIAGAEAEAERAAGLVEAQDEYIELLKREIEGMVGIAYAHGWRSDNHEGGAAMREKIEELKAKYNNSK